MLRDELLNDPAGLGYAAHIPHAPGKLTEMLNAPAGTMPKTRFVTARAILAELDDGAAVLDALEAAGPAFSAVRWALDFLRGPDGIDVGHSRTQQMIDALALHNALTQAQATALKAMANQPASRAEMVLGTGSIVSEADVRAALENQA